MDTPDYFLSIVNSFYNTNIMEQAQVAGALVGVTVTPFLIMIALKIRFIEAIKSGTPGDAGNAWRDTIFYTFLIAGYWIFSYLIIHFMDTFYAALRDQMAVYAVHEQLNMILHRLDAMDAEAMKDSGFLDKAGRAMHVLGDNIASLPFWGAYEATLLFVVGANVFLGFIYQSIYALAFIWGFLAIPAAITRIGRPMFTAWGVLVAIVLAWPVVEILLLYLLGLYVDRQQNVIFSQNNPAESQKAAVYIIFTVVNFLLAIVYTLSPKIASLLFHRGSPGGLIGLGVFAPATAMAVLGYKAAQSGYGLLKGTGIGVRDVFGRGNVNGLNGGGNHNGGGRGGGNNISHLNNASQQRAPNTVPYPAARSVANSQTKARPTPVKTTPAPASTNNASVNQSTPNTSQSQAKPIAQTKPSKKYSQSERGHIINAMKNRKAQQQQGDK